jgi:hypothetical protein
MNRKRTRELEFEMAYQARVAADRIRFAIKHTGSVPAQSDVMREAGFQLDALQQLEAIDHRFPGTVATRRTGRSGAARRKQRS